jgi:hypothetical protein
MTTVVTGGDSCGGARKERTRSNFETFLSDSVRVHKKRDNWVNSDFKTYLGFTRVVRQLGSGVASKPFIL